MYTPFFTILHGNVPDSYKLEFIALTFSLCILQISEIEYFKNNFEPPWILGWRWKIYTHIMLRLSNLDLNWTVRRCRIVNANFLWAWVSEPYNQRILAVREQYGALLSDVMVQRFAFQWEWLSIFLIFGNTPVLSQSLIVGVHRQASKSGMNIMIRYTRLTDWQSYDERSIEIHNGI